MIQQWRRSRRPPLPDREYLRLTSADDGREHRIREGDAIDNGRCVALCGHVVILGALAAPPGRPCSTCTAAAEGAS